MDRLDTVLEHSLRASRGRTKGAAHTLAPEGRLDVELGQLGVRRIVEQARCQAQGCESNRLAGDLGQDRLLDTTRVQKPLG